MNLDLECNDSTVSDKNGDVVVMAAIPVPTQSLCISTGDGVVSPTQKQQRVVKKEAATDDIANNKKFRRRLVAVTAIVVLVYIVLGIYVDWIMCASILGLPILFFILCAPRPNTDKGGLGDVGGYGWMYWG
jgi:hypothetical protein